MPSLSLPLRRLLSLGLSLGLSLLPRAAEAALDAGSLELVWYDEFGGGAVDWDKWVVDVGDGCDVNLCDWGNAEQQVSRGGESTAVAVYLRATAQHAILKESL